MHLEAPDSRTFEWARWWRNADVSHLRTPFMLTKEMQSSFYEDVICSRTSPHRYWAVWEGGSCIALAGFTDIQWENRIAEISIIVDPKHRGEGAGKKIVRLIVKEGFGNMNLQTIFGECYMCNTATGFWRQLVGELRGYMTSLPKRKYWNGQYHDSLYFSFDRKCLCNLKTT